MADDAATPPTGAGDAAGFQWAPAQDPDASAAADKNGDAVAPPTEVANTFSSLAIDASSTTDVAEDVPAPPPPAPAPAPAPAPEEDGVINDEDATNGAARPAQQLPLNIPNIAGLDDADAAAALDNEFLSLLPPSILPRVDRLRTLNAKRDEILEEYRLERAALEAKFFEKMRPLYEERRGVVNGELDEVIAKEKGGGEGVVDDKKKEKEAEGGEGMVEDVNEEEENAAEEGVGGGAQGGENIKGIPQFWACAMGHVDVIAELITEADVDCLDHLTDITCSDFPDGTGFELTFHFSPNAFFTNATLTKRYEVPNLLTEDEPILKNVTGSTIDWKKGRSLTYREITKKQRKKGGRGAGQVRTVTKKERSESFFHFFTPPEMPPIADVMDEEEADAVEEAFDHDYDVAQAFRGHLIPKAVLWFTGEAMMDDYEDGEEEEGEGEEDMEDDEEGGAAGGAGGQQQFVFNGGNNDPFPPPAAGGGENPECKQN